MAQQDFSGNWHFCYWFPSNEHEGEDASEYDGHFVKRGKELVFESAPNKEQSYILSRLTLDEDNLATGTWHEQTSPTGFFKGMEYSGAGQLLFDPEAHKFTGMWAGIGLDRTSNKPNIYSGRWEIKRN